MPHQPHPGPHPGPAPAPHPGPAPAPHPHPGPAPAPHPGPAPDDGRPNDRDRPGPDDGGNGDGPDAPADPREGWMAGYGRQVGEKVRDKAAEKTGDWVNDKLFGSDEEAGEGPGGSAEGRVGAEGGAGGAYGGEGIGEDGGEGEAGAEGLGTATGGVVGGIAGSAFSDRMVSPVGPYPGAMPGGSGSAAYGWSQAGAAEAPAPLEAAGHPDRSGLGGMLDEAVQWALEKSGLMDELEKVTGNLAELNAAAEEWQAQARAVQSVADQLRGGAQPLSGSWEGQASDAFGTHMGEVVDALDSTAEGMYQTAEIISRAAQECAVAEGMVVDIIAEAIEALIVSLAAEAVIAVFTAGIGVIADALITEAEIGVFVARVAKVSTELAENLEKLLKALKELGQAVKAVRNLRTARTALDAVKDVKAAAQGLREFEEGGDGLMKAGKAALKDKDFSGLTDYAARQAVKKGDEYVTGKAQDAFKGALGMGEDEELPSGTPGEAAKDAAKEAAKSAFLSDTNKDAMKDEVLTDLGLHHEPAPYRVDRSRIETAFG
ncbi:hypothetical protein GCM10025734_26380 [Kitasatospora paranensis]